MDRFCLFMSFFYLLTTTTLPAGPDQDKDTPDCTTDFKVRIFLFYAQHLIVLLFLSNTNILLLLMQALQYIHAQYARNK